MKKLIGIVSIIVAGMICIVVLPAIALTKVLPLSDKESRGILDHVMIIKNEVDHSKEEGYDESLIFVEFLKVLGYLWKHIAIIVAMVMMWIRMNPYA